jgi:hypothetical protein
MSSAGQLAFAAAGAAATPAPIVARSSRAALAETESAPVAAESQRTPQTPASLAFAFGAGARGQPLDDSTRASMELRFGHDFSRVRVHADARAGESAEALNARAFAVGSHLVFGAGQYSPQSDAGRRLLAHELSHVVQQRAGTVQQAATISQRDDPSERQAERIADAVAAGRRAPELPAAQHGAVADAGAVAVQRDLLPYLDRKDVPWFYPLRYAFGDPHSVPVGKAGRIAQRGIEFVSKWGRTASPFNVLSTYFKLNKSGFADLSDVSKRVKLVKELRSRVDQLEREAWMLRNAVNEQWQAEEGLPEYPLDTAESAGHVLATPDELAYVEKYYEAAALVANDAMRARVMLNESISGWDDVVAKAGSSADFTREAAWDAVTDLELRFQSHGRFRAFLADARDRAAQVESWARVKQYHAADILGKWTPPNYRAPTPSDPRR